MHSKDPWGRDTEYVTCLGGGDTEYVLNSLLPNDAIWRHDLCVLSISLWEFICGV